MAHEQTPNFWLADDMGDLFGSIGIMALRTRLSPGANAKLMCPKCEGGRTKEQSLSVRVDPDGQGAAWNCKRGNCGWKGSGRFKGSERQDEAPARRERVYVQPEVEAPAKRARPPGLLAWFASRGISEETVEALGIYGVQKRFPQLEPDGAVVKDEEGKVVWETKPAVIFPYEWEGQIVNRKARSPQKQFMQDKESLRTLFNAQSVTADDELILVEGEMDVAACWEAGYRQVVSIPDGTPSKLLDEDDPAREGDLRYEALETCSGILAPIRKVIIATDMDVPGGYLAEEFARRLGPARCWRVTWPAGAKDANDVLLRHVPKGQQPTPEQIELGRADIRAAVEAATPWPMAGIFTLNPGTLSQFLHDRRMPRGLECGIRDLDDVARLPAGPGWLTIVTGIPSHGKTRMLKVWLAYQAMKHGLGIVWCSPEDNRPEIIALDLAQIIAGQPLQEAGTYIPDSALREAEQWIEKHITFIYADDASTEMTMDWVLAKAELAKKRRPRNLLVVDPWNEVEHSYDARKESETQYTGRWLRKMKAWGRAEGFSLLIAAHPKQQMLDPKTKKYPVVDGYAISGSANWYNRADLGLTIYRREEGYMEVHCWKARFPGFGKRNGMARLEIEKRSQRLKSASLQQQDQADMLDPPPAEQPPHREEMLA